MNRPDDLYRELGDWLSDGPTEVADRVIEGALETIQQTSQRRRQRVPWRFPAMPFANRLALVAMLILATVGTTLVVSTGISPSPAGPRAMIVAQDGSGDFTTITEAAAVAQDGETVLVRPGIYRESIAITEDITLRGDGDPGAVVIEFSADGPTHPLEEEPFAYGILLDDSDAQVVNITVRGRQNAAGSEKAISAVMIAGGGPVIMKLDVILDGDPYPDYPHRMRRAISILGGSNAVVRDSSWDGFTELVGSANSPRFEGNTVTAQRIRIAGVGQNPTISGNTLLDGASIVFGEPGSSGTVEDNDIVGCIGVGTEGNTIIRGNRIQGGCGPDPSGAAISIGGPSAVVVVDNEITDSPYGIQVASGATPEISRNTIRGSVSAAIVVDSAAAPTIDGNTIEGNATGIEVTGTSKPVITGNTLCDNGTDLVVPAGSTLTLAGNTICGEAVSAAP